MTSTNEQQPTTMWEIKSYKPERIVPVKVIKRTAKTVWIERLSCGMPFIEQCRKGNVFHDSWESAHKHLLACAVENVEREKRALNSARSCLGEIEKMKSPSISLD